MAEVPGLVPVPVSVSMLVPVSVSVPGSVPGWGVEHLLHLDALDATLRMFDFGAWTNPLLGQASAAPVEAT